MLPKTSISFESVPCRRGAAPTHQALLSSFLAPLREGSTGSFANYGSAARHFLDWLDRQGIAVSDIDDGIVRRFAKHRCSCPRYSSRTLRSPDYMGRVRRFVRHLEDQGHIPVGDDVEHLAGHLADFSDHLADQGYSLVSARGYRSEAEHFACWLRLSGLTWAEIGALHVERYADHHCHCAVTRKRGRLVEGTGTAHRRRGARRFLAFLRERGVLEGEQTNTSIPADDRIAAFRDWLKRHRGSTDATIRRYAGEIAHCLPILGEPAVCDAATIRHTVAHRIEQSPGSAALIVIILRSYLRFLAAQGACRPALINAVPPVRRFRLSTLPRYTSEAMIEKIVTSCGTARPVDIRDKAIVLLLARLGLRAGDICQMRLTDIDWNAGYLDVSGKARRATRLPLPQDAGDAVLAYLAQARPKVNEERVFLRAQPPFTPFKSSAEIAGIVARVLERGGIEGLPTGAHIFRHSLATNMLRAGAGLESVGTILRHRSPDTTAIYAKVDVAMLQKLAQPWPGDLPC